MHWIHGYFAGSSYTSGFYRELAPNWLDFAALVKAIPSPRLQEGTSFHFLEIGSGMGFGLCMLAGAYPEGNFVGIDVMPDHIAHSERIAARLGISNVCFLEADLIRLIEQPEPLERLGIRPGSCDYVVAHGLLSWVEDAVQRAMLQLASSCLHSGGLFYCSYNTYPGWLARSMYQQLVQQEMDQSGPAGHEAALDKAADTITKLLGTHEDPTPLAQNFPLLGNDMTEILKESQTYLMHEFGNRSWQPLYVADMHKRCRDYGFSFVGSATLPELFPEWLPERIRSMIEKESNPLLQESVKDIAIVQSFRRDIFVRGRAPFHNLEQNEKLAGLWMRRLLAPALDTYKFQASIGTITGNPELLSTMEKFLEKGPATIEELMGVLEVPLEEIVKLVVLLVHAGRLGFDRQQAAPGAIKAGQEVNAILLELIRAGLPYTFVVAPAAGTALYIDCLQACLQEGIDQGLEDEMLFSFVMMGLQVRGITLSQRNGEPFSSQEELLTQMAEREAILRNTTLPCFQALGVLPTATA